VTIEFMLRVLAIGLIAALIFVRLRFRRGARASCAAWTGLLVPLAHLVIMAIWWLGLIGYVLHPSLVAWADLPAPQGGRWLGLALGVSGLALLAWAQQVRGCAIGGLFSRADDAPPLVVSGPYAFVRQPICSALMLFAVGLLLASANAWVSALPILVAAVTVSRARAEERALIEHYGPGYLLLMNRTGRFLPRLSRLDFWYVRGIRRKGSHPGMLE